MKFPLNIQGTISINIKNCYDTLRCQTEDWEQIISRRKILNSHEEDIFWNLFPRRRQG